MKVKNISKKRVYTGRGFNAFIKPGEVGLVNKKQYDAIVKVNDCLEVIEDKKAADPGDE